MLHEQSGTVGFCWREQQVYMIGHQHIGVHGAAELVGKLFQVLQVELVILFSMKADGAIVAALDDVPRNAGKGKAGAAGHEGLDIKDGEATLAENNRGLSPIVPLLFSLAHALFLYFSPCNISFSIRSM